MFGHFRDFRSNKGPLCDFFLCEPVRGGCVWHFLTEIKLSRTRVHEVCLVEQQKHEGFHQPTNWTWAFSFDLPNTVETGLTMIDIDITICDSCGTPNKNNHHVSTATQKKPFPTAALKIELLKSGSSVNGSLVLNLAVVYSMLGVSPQVVTSLKLAADP